MLMDFFFAILLILIMSGLLPACLCSDWPNNFSFYQDCWNVRLLWLLLPEVMSHTWTLVVFPAWCRQCEDVGFRIVQLCQALTGNRGTNACSFLEGGSLLSHLASVWKKRWGKDDLLISSFSCSEICNHYHWVVVAAVSKQNNPPCCWNIIGVPLCPSSWRHPAVSGSRGKSSLISGDLRWNLNRDKT